MKRYALESKIKIAINMEAKRIFDELLELYNKKTIVNKSFNILVEERIDIKYTFFIPTITMRVTKLIPLDLYVCPNHKWVFVTEHEFYSILKDDRIKSLESKKKVLKTLPNEMYNKILKLYNEKELNDIDIFDVLYDLIPNHISKKIGEDECEYLIQETINIFRKNNLDILDVLPIKIGTIKN